MHTILAGVTLCLLVLLPRVQAAEMDARLRVAINLFPAFLSAAATDSASAGNREVVLVYADMTPRVRAAVDHLRHRLGAKLPNRTLTVSSLGEWDRRSDLQGVAAVFLGQKLDHADFRRVLERAGKAGIPTYSPVPGDVSRGALGGISITDRILPKINMRTLRGYGFRFKSFYLDVADRHE